MNIKKAAMMLTIMLITILSASSFYILTGEAELNENIIVNSSTGDKTEEGDYEKVYGEGPYKEKSGAHKNQSYYIRYTGKISKRSLVDLEDTNVTDKNGKKVNSGLTIHNGNIVILNTNITSTYKMFSYRSDSKQNTEVERVIIPSTIAIDNDGLESNTFDGYTVNEKDCIYRTPDLGNNVDERGSGLDKTYDKTGIITQSNVITYVCLDKNNINRQGITADYSNAYNGQIDNVYISDELDVLDYLFAIDGSWGNDVPIITNQYNSNKEINYVLFEGGKSWTTKKNLTYMFDYQTKLNFCNHFSIPDNVVSLRLMFGHCAGITQFLDNFTIPNGVESIQGMFSGCISLKSFPDNFSLPNSLTNMTWAFGTLTSLKKMPDNFIIPNSVKEMDHAFAYSYLLTGTFVIPEGVEKMDDCFTYTSTKTSSSDCLYGYNTPTVMKYYTNNNYATNYSSNVLTQTQTGFVTKVPITNQSDWETVNDNDNGTNSDDNGTNKYYLHYKGETTTVDLDDKSVYPTTSDGYPSILSTRVYSTYKMFAKIDSDDFNENLYRVFIPSSIAITSNKLEDNTFLNTTQEIDCIYHTGDVSNKNYGRSLVLNGIYDKTSIFNESNANGGTNVVPYVYLGTENFYRTPSSAYAIKNGTSLEREQYSYLGTIQNIYVSNQVTDIEFLFSRFGIYFPNKTYWQRCTKIHKVLLDDNGKWNRMSWLFVYQDELDLSEKFYIPNSDIVEVMPSFFVYTNITHLPKAFSIPKNVTNIYAVFCGCPNLSGIIKIPANVKMMDSCFANSGTNSKEKLGSKGQPIVMQYYSNCSAAASYSAPSTVEKVSLGTWSSQSLIDQSQSVISDGVDNVKDSSQNIVIEDSTEEISVKVNEISSEKLIVEDETDLVSVTVNKNVEENKSDGDESQE